MIGRTHKASGFFFGYKYFSMLLHIMLDCTNECHAGHCRHGQPMDTPEHEKCMVRNAGQCPWTELNRVKPFDNEELDEIQDYWDNEKD